MAKILVTDDSMLMRDLISEIVKQYGHSVEHASSGEELLEMYAEDKADLVILDLVMMGMSGLNALDKLMEMDKGAKVLVCSAMAGQKEVADDAMKRGARAVINKPFSANELSTIIQRELGEE